MADSKELQTPAKVRPKPPAAGKGRPKGTPNKNTGMIKDMILQALNNAGGAEYLTERANDPRTAAAFLGLVGKVMPVQVTGDPNNPVQHSIRVTFG